MADDRRYETIRIEKQGAVDWLVLDRPESLNAIDLRMATELRDYFGRLEEERSVRVVVMRGEGRAFCAGLDLKDAATVMGPDGPYGRGFGFQGYLADVYLRMRRCPQPIVALVHGAACGGGFSFVLASDIRIAAESAKMNAAFIKVGLSACDMGCSYFLPRLVGTSVASELMLTGRFLRAERALATGLVSEVVPDDRLVDAARPYVEEMLAASPRGLRMTKEGLTMAIDAASLEAAMAIENRNQLLCSQSANVAEGMRAFVEKRPPVYVND
ncbi:MAG: enoyl-CoA hydratase/isomerase family protein [Spirochaetaceae bacterium]|nr:enoyl-CoA hydratase/isomerase family protein [Myxococcales bacterium]MCB9726022.1 enoyl-CoA hydratase/isomerase family protein [Spirochaetaceae bacterium]HPG25677.1 enoyl-CoA hydratase/isomerase family protein [Myxococcota bacterium]